jgi:hypothetical protein
MMAAYIEKDHAAIDRRGAAEEARWRSRKEALETALRKASFGLGRDGE